MNFAVLDCETNFNDEVVSVGVAISDFETMTNVHKLYLLVTPEYLEPSMFLDRFDAVPHDAVVNRTDMIAMVKKFLKKYNTTTLFAYNAAFDHRLSLLS